MLIFPVADSLGRIPLQLLPLGSGLSILPRSSGWVGTVRRGVHETLHGEIQIWDLPLYQSLMNEYRLLILAWKYFPFESEPMNASYSP